MNGIDAIILQTAYMTKLIIADTAITIARTIGHIFVTIWAIANNAINGIVKIDSIKLNKNIKTLPFLCASITGNGLCAL